MTEISLHNLIFSTIATLVAYGLLATLPWLLPLTRGTKSVASLAVILGVALIVPEVANRVPIQEARDAVKDDVPLKATALAGDVMLVTHTLADDGDAKRVQRLMQMSAGGRRPRDPLDQSLPRSVTCQGSCQRLLAIGHPRVTVARRTEGRDYAVSWHQATDDMSSLGAQWLMPSQRRADGRAISPVLKGNFERSPQSATTIISSEVPSRRAEIKRIEVIANKDGQPLLVGRATAALYDKVATPLAIRVASKDGPLRISIWTDKVALGQADEAQVLNTLFPGDGP